jgi:hypothetical protein
MSNLAQGRGNRGKWLILLILILSCGAILPLSWHAIQAQRAQQSTMKALKKSLTEIESALKTERCRSAVLAPANALVAQARSVDAVFPQLSQAPGEFAHLSRALVRSSVQFAALAKMRDCGQLKLNFPALKQRCNACHEQFDPQRSKKF